MGRTRKSDGKTGSLFNQPKKDETMCKCTPNKRTPFCGAPGCEAPPQRMTMNEPAKDVTPGTVWQHYNGNVYTVIDILNPDNPPDDDKPPFVSYIGTNGKRWGRRLDDWLRSFTLLYGPQK